MPDYPIYSSDATTAEAHLGWMPSSSPLINAYAGYTLLVISGYFVHISTCQFLFVEGRGRDFTGVLSARAITKLDAEKGKTWGWSLLPGSVSTREDTPQQPHTHRLRKKRRKRLDG